MEMRYRKSALLVIILILVGFILTRLWQNGIQTTLLDKNAKEKSEKDPSTEPLTSTGLESSRENSEKVDSVTFTRHTSQKLKTRPSFTNQCNSYVPLTSINYTHLESLLSKMVPKRYLKGYKSYCWTGDKLINPKFRSTRDRMLVGGLNQTTKGIVCFPSVFMAGFPMSGSNYFYNILTTHPHVRGGNVSQPHFWTKFPFKNSNDLDNHAINTYLANYNSGAECPQCVTIDVSQSLLWDTTNSINDCSLPKLISKLMPSAKFIIFLRDPIERLFSEFYMFGMTNCKEKLPVNMIIHHFFEIKIVSEIERFRQCRNSHSDEYCAHYTLITSPPVYEGCGTLRLSPNIYSIHLKRWLQFFPKNQFLFLRLEDVKSDLYKTMQHIWSFIGVEHLSREVFEKLRLKIGPFRRGPSPYGLMKQSTRNALKEFFDPYTQDLEIFLKDKNFSVTGY